MEFSEFILAHEGEEVSALALKRERFSGEVEDFDLALTTLEVRRKLRDKVPEWFAVPSLRFPFRLSGEQCSSSETARYKAQVALAACGGHAFRLADLTGGMGVDSWAFAQLFQEVLYNEMRSDLAAAASQNFHALGLANIVVRNCTLAVSPEQLPARPTAEENYFSGRCPKNQFSSAIAMPTHADAVRPVRDDADRPFSVAEVLGGFQPDIIFLDPARRAEDGRKVFRLEDCQPNVLQLLPDLFAAAPLLLLKLSPMADITQVTRQLRHVREVHVVAADGECKELLLLLQQGYEGPHILTLYESGALMKLSGGETGEPESLATLGLIRGRGPQQVPEGHSEMGGGAKRRFGHPSLPSGDLEGKCLFEPGKAMMKAGAFELPCGYGLEKLGQHTHLYVGAEVPEELQPFGKCYEILEALPLNKRSLKELGRKYPQAEVTARNIPLSSDQLRTRLGVRSGGEAHLFGVKADGEQQNLLLVTRRMDKPGTRR